MKKLFRLIITLMLSTPLFAQNWDTAVIVAGSVGVIVGTEYSIYQSLVKRELKGWANKETGTTVKLENQCQLQTEFHLMGDYKQNYIMMGITNITGQQVAVNFRQIKFVVNGTRERFPGYSYQVEDQVVHDGWWTLAHIPLPKKSEFADYEHIRVEVPVYQLGMKEPCRIVTEFKRTKNIPEENVSYNVFEFSLDLGPSLSQSGNIKRLGDPNFMWGMGFNWYFKPQHGFGMAFLSESGFEGTQKSGKLHNGTVVSFDLHYVYRHFLASKLSLQLEPGLGWQGLIEDYNCRYCDKNRTSSFMADYRLMLQYVLGSWTVADVSLLDFFIGGGIVHQYAFGGRINGADIDGSRLGLLFRLGMGF